MRIHQFDEILPVGDLRRNIRRRLAISIALRGEARRYDRISWRRR